MRRSGMPPRTTRIARGTTRIRPKKRSKAESERIYGDADRQAWTRTLSCLACQRMPVEIAHVVTGGMGRKASSSETVPLCTTCHHTLHMMGVRTFERAYADILGGHTLRQHAAKYDAAYRAFLGAQGAS